MILPDDTAPTSPIKSRAGPPSEAPQEDVNPPPPPYAGRSEPPPPPPRKKSKKEMEREERWEEEMVEEVGGYAEWAALGEEERRAVVAGIVSEVWDAKLRGWREREGVVVAVGQMVKETGDEDGSVRKLVMKGLRDPVAAVREASVGVVSSILSS